MTAPAQWNQLASALRELHRALMERGRRDYERQHGTVLDPAELLRLLTTDEHFQWLRGLSELMVDIDVVRDAEPQVMADLAGPVRAAVERFIVAPQAGAAADAFAQRYWPYMQDDPNVAMSHGAVKKALAGWPPAQDTDAARWLHERHALSEKLRHRRKPQ